MKPIKAIYLDWNVFQDIKQNRSCDGLQELIIAAKKNGFKIPYSSAHMRDLSRSTSEKYIIEDLNFISSLTNNYCVGYGNTDESAFQYLKHDPKDILSTFNLKKVNSESNNNCQLEFEQYEVDLNKLSSDNILVPYLKENNSVMSMSVVNKFANDFFNSYYDNPQQQKLFRKSFQEICQLSNPAFVFLMETPLYKHIFSDTATISREFNSIVNSFLSMSGKSLESIPYGEKITTSYNILDFFPAFSERIDKKNNIKNSTTDAEHVFLGSSAQYFVASDKKIIEKAQVLKANFNITTKFYLKEDFIRHVSFM